MCRERVEKGERVLVTTLTKKTAEDLSEYIQETGLNTLYLVLGHLDWIEAKSSKDARSAPLFTIPVTLKKGNLDPKSQTYIYTIEHSGARH